MTSAPVYGSGLIENQRADLINPAIAIYKNRVPAQGGQYLLNSAAFAEPASDSIPGTSGRNAFRGPGLYNVDTSLARVFHLAKLAESSVIEVRADMYNVLNHANLGNPDNLLGSPTFGLATYGRQGKTSGFPAVAPLNETSRQLQVSVKYRF